MATASELKMKAGQQASQNFWTALQMLFGRLDQIKAEESQKREAEGKKEEQALNVAMKIADKTGKYGQVNKLLESVYPGMGMEITQPKIGGVKKTVPVTADVTKGDIATKEVVEGGVTVTPETKEKFDLADYMVREGVITEEQRTEYLTKIKPKKTPQPTAPQAKANVLTEAGATPEQIIKAFGGYIKTKEPQVVEIGVPGKPNYKQRAVFDFGTNTITKRIGPPYKARTEAQKSTKDKMLDRLASDYFQETGRYGSASRGVGQFIQDPNKEFVAQFHLKNAAKIAEQYKNLGGNLADLGITQTEYNTPEEVKAALMAGKITKEEADKILLEQWPEMFTKKKK